jgi:hypothetical protein
MRRLNYPYEDVLEVACHLQAIVDQPEISRDPSWKVRAEAALAKLREFENAHCERCGETFSDGDRYPSEGPPGTGVCTRCHWGLKPREA